jgi:hypothetical protein
MTGMGWDFTGKPIGECRRLDANVPADYGEMDQSDRIVRSGEPPAGRPKS